MSELPLSTSRFEELSRMNVPHEIASAANAFAAVMRTELWPDSVEAAFKGEPGKMEANPLTATQFITRGIRIGGRMAKMRQERQGINSLTDVLEVPLAEIPDDELVKHGVSDVMTKFVGLHPDDSYGGVVLNLNQANGLGSDSVRAGYTLAMETDWGALPGDVPFDAPYGGHYET